MRASDLCGSALAAFSIVGLLACGSPDSAVQSDPTDPVARRLDTYLERMVPFGFAGVVLVARNDLVLLDRGYGWADEAGGVLNSAETRFPIESISKQFTAATLLRLEMEGLIDLNVSIAEYLPGVPEDKASITPHHLLTHTSGLMTGTEEYLEENTRDAIVATALSRPLLFEPGERDAYSNIGYALLAAIVEHLTGEDFHSHQESSIFSPAGLRRTGSVGESGSADRVARRYADGIDFGSPLDIPSSDWNHVGSGDILSTTGDLYRWHHALLGNEVLSEEAKEKMYTPVANGYGYGWFVSEGDHGLLIEHDGGSSRGSGGDFARYVDEGVTIVVLSNRDAEYMLFGARLMEKITEIAFGGSVSPPPELAAGGPETPGEEYAGDYRFADGTDVRVAVAGSLLEFRGIGQRSVAGLLDFSEAEAAGHERMNERTAELLSGVVVGDYALLSTVSRGSMGTRLEEMFGRLSTSLGNPTGFAVMGTVPPTGVEAAEYMTLFTVSYPDRPRSFRFYWRGGEVIALGGGGLSEPVRVRAVAADRDEFLGYHVSTGRSARLRFQRDSRGRVVGIDFGDSVGVAGKVDSPWPDGLGDR